MNIKDLRNFLIMDVIQEGGKNLSNLFFCVTVVVNSALRNAVFGIGGIKRMAGMERVGSRITDPETGITSHGIGTNSLLKAQKQKHGYKNGLRNDPAFKGHFHAVVASL